MTNGSLVYFAASAQANTVKIGFTTVQEKRWNQHRGYGFKFYAAICGTRDNEQAIHRHFESYRVPDTEELFYRSGDVQEYLEWLGTRAWAACTADEIDEAYPHPGRWPWSPRHIEREASQPWLFRRDLVPGLRKPLSRSQRILATIRSDSDEWYTPPIYVEAARDVMGGIDLDPASCPLANQLVGATAIFTTADDGLNYEWHGRVWLNPPYGNQKDKFVEHCIAEFTSGRVSEAVMCLNAHAVDTVWFQSLWKYPICFTHHRVRFLGGKPGQGDPEDGAPTTGTAFVYLGKSPERFATTFSRFGPVVGVVQPASVPAEEFRKMQAAGADWSTGPEPE